MKVLVCFDGSDTSAQSARWLRILNFPNDTKINVIQVIEGGITKPRFEINFDVPKLILNSYFNDINYQVCNGNAAKEIIDEIKSESYDLVVMGDKGRGHSFLHKRLGKTLSRVLKSVEIPILVGRIFPEELKRILMCTSGEAIAQQNLEKGAKFLSYGSFDVTILHVMSQLALQILPDSQDLVDSAQSAIQRKTREGIHLSQVMDQVRTSGVTGDVRAVLRHGLVIDQVSQEILEGKYGLLVIGSHHSPDGKQWLEFLLENLAFQILSEATCSVLVVY